MFCLFNQMQEEPDEDSQCLSDDTDTEISTQVGTPPTPTPTPQCCGFILLH